MNQFGGYYPLAPCSFGYGTLAGLPMGVGAVGSFTGAGNLNYHAKSAAWEPKKRRKNLTNKEKIEIILKLWKTAKYADCKPDPGQYQALAREYKLNCHSPILEVWKKKGDLKALVTAVLKEKNWKNKKDQFKATLKGLKDKKEDSKNRKEPNQQDDCEPSITNGMEDFVLQFLEGGAPAEEGRPSRVARGDKVSFNPWNYGEQEQNKHDLRTPTVYRREDFEPWLAAIRECSGLADRILRGIEAQDPSIIKPETLQRLSTGRDTSGRDTTDRGIVLLTLEFLEQEGKLEGFLPSALGVRPNAIKDAVQAIYNSSRYTTRTHYDEGNFLLLVLRGTKEIYFARERDKLDNSEKDHSASLAYSDKPFDDEEATEKHENWLSKVVLSAGQALLIPYGWAHCVRTEPHSFAISVDLSPADN